MTSKLAAFVSALVLLVPGTAVAASDPALSRRLDEYLAARARLGQFSGSVLVSSAGDVVLRKGYGFANVERRTRNSPATSFEIASLTKAFTAYAILLLAQDGKLRPDQSVTKYLPNCPAAWKDVTIAELVHHTSGIWDYEGSLEFGSATYAEWMNRPGTGRSLVEEAKTKPLDFPPGSKFHYSNTGYLILGLVIERVSGLSYEEFLRRRIFKPLGMHATRHVDRRKPESWGAIGYTHAAPLDSSVLGFPLSSHWLTRTPEARLDAPHADGGLLSTIDDLYRWTRALDGPGPIPPALRDTLAGPPDEGYGWGWITGRRVERKRLFHTGVLPGFVSEIDRFPNGTTIIVLGNLDRARIASIVRDLTSIVFGQPYDLPRSHRVGPIDSLAARPYLGRYMLDDGRALIVRHDAAGKMLEAESPGQFIAGLLPESGGVFYAPMWEGTVTFAGDSAGTRTRLLVRQMGKNIGGRRVGD